MGEALKNMFTNNVRKEEGREEEKKKGREVGRK